MDWKRGALLITIVLCLGGCTTREKASEGCDALTCGTGERCDESGGEARCVATDPCATTTCGAHQACRATSGTASCECTAGFVLEAGACVAAGPSDLVVPLTASSAEYELRAGSDQEWDVLVSGPQLSISSGAMLISETETRDGKRGRTIQWEMPGELWAGPAGGAAVDLSAFQQHRGAIDLTLRVESPPSLGNVMLFTDCGPWWDCRGQLELSAPLMAMADGLWHTLTVPLACLEGSGLNNGTWSAATITRLFGLWSGARGVVLTVEDVRWRARAALESPDCSQFAQPKQVVPGGRFDLSDSASTGPALRWESWSTGGVTPLGGGAQEVEFNNDGTARLLAWPALDLSAYAGGSLRFDLLLASALPADAKVEVGLNGGIGGTFQVVDVTPHLVAMSQWVSVTVPLADVLAAPRVWDPNMPVLLENIASPFHLRVLSPSGDPVRLQFANMRLEGP